MTEGTCTDQSAEWTTGPCSSSWTVSALPQAISTTARLAGRAVSGSYVTLSSSTRRFTHSGDDAIGREHLEVRMLVGKEWVGSVREPVRNNFQNSPP